MRFAHIRISQYRLTTPSSLPFLMRQSASFSSSSQLSLGLKRKASSPLSSADAPDDDELDSQLTTTTTTTTTTSPNASQSKATSAPSKPKTKRKTSSKQSGIEPNSEGGQPTKATGSDVPLLLAWNGMPTNKALPPIIDFPPKKEGIRIVAWNVCGLVSAIKKGFFHYLAAENPDILILTETKVFFFLKINSFVR